VKNFVKYIFIIISLLFSNNLFSQTNEKWIKIDSLDSYDEIEGLWEGNAKSIIKVNIDGIDFISSLNITLFCNYKKGDTTINHIVKFDFIDLIIDLENFWAIREIEYTKETIWQGFKEMIDPNDTTLGDYWFSHLTIMDTDEYFASDSEGQFYVSENRDFLYLVYYEPSFILGIEDSGFTEMIFSKIK
jgi:hypothetical protein